jgi:sortase A
MVQFGHGLYIPAKAVVAQHMMQRAWRLSLREDIPEAARIKPWPWADTWPVARLYTPDRDNDLIVLAGGSGRTLAFGPGHLTASALPGERGNTIIAGHRDTHFRFLADVTRGDVIVVERPDGRRIDYEVVALDVADARRSRIRLDTDTPLLTLVTCYPFDALEPGGPLRYVVTLAPTSVAPQVVASR